MNGIKSINLVALDSNVFIYQFESNPEFIHLTEKIFDSIGKGRLRAITSVISTAEALSYPSPPEVIKGITDGFLTLVNLEIVDVNQHIAFEAARIRREYGFRLPDSIQLATALQAKAKAFISNDQRLKKFKELKVILITEI